MNLFLWPEKRFSCFGGREVIENLIWVEAI